MTEARRLRAVLVLGGVRLASTTGCAAAPRPAIRGGAAYTGSRLVLLALALSAGMACGSRPPVRIPAPDARHTFVATVNESRADATKYLCLRVRIVDGEDRVRYEEQTGASARMAWHARWTDARRVELDSSDVGLLAWRRRPDGDWERER